jgi:5-hydroxyisourate hydrolase-like protein (transthyretin family)
VDEETRDLIAELSQQLGMRKAPVAYATCATGQPFVWGWLVGSIYLPPQFARMGDAAQRRTVLMHELAHVARWDAAMNLFQLFVQAIFFFHPLVWWANREIRKEREKCCDEIVLSSSRTSPRQYCEAIVEVMAHPVQGRHSAPALAVTGRLEAVEERIATILTPHRRFARRASWLARGVVLAAACCVLPTALVPTSRAQSSADAPGADGAGKDGWKKGQTLEVRIVDAQTQEPLPDVTLELQNMGEGIDFQDVKTFTTDVDGRSVLPLSDLPPTAVRVYPTKAGYVPLRLIWEREPWPTLPASITVPLQRGKAFGGTIENEAGEPISDVKVTMQYWAVGEGESPHIRANILAEATTDKEGRWHVDVMPEKVRENELYIFVSHPGYVSDRLKPGFLPLPVTEEPPIEQLYDQTAVMKMKRGDSIEGKVVDERGNPIANAAVHIDEQYWWQKEHPSSTTDETGKFHLSGFAFDTRDKFVRPGDIPLYLTVQAAGYAPELIGVKESGAIPVVTLRPGMMVRGRIVDVSGKPLEGVSMIARRWRGQSDRLGMGMKSKADGSFEIADLPVDEVLYDFSKDGYMSVDSFAMTAGTTDYVVTLKPPLKISGAVVDADTGAPIGRFDLIEGTDYEDGRSPFWQRVMAKHISGGKYEAEFSQEDFAWRLRVEAEGYMPSESRIFRPYKPDQGEIVFDFRLRKAEPLSGTVLGLKGELLADADVYLSIERVNIEDAKVVYHGDSRLVQTDKAGRFTFPAEVEPFCVVAVHPDGIAMATEKEFAQSPELQIDAWTDDNQRLQIIRRPAPGQLVNFPPPGE